MNVNIELFNTLKEECLELIFMFGDDGSFISCSNKARESLGDMQDESCGRFEINFPNIDLEETGMLEPVETDVYRKNETCFPADVKIVRFENDKFIVFAIDQTETRNMAREIKACKEELKSELKYHT